MKNQRFQQSLKSNTFGLLILLAMACASEKTIDVQGHRGCRGLMPENSLPAFQKAIDLGVNTLELDIVISKDNKVVVSHEPFMSRKICYNPSGSEISEAMDMAYNLYEMTHEEIKTFDCGSKFHASYPNQTKIKVYKPLLREVFDLVRVNEANVNFNIEIKSNPRYYGLYTPEPKAYVALVLQEIETHGMMQRSTLQSFDLNILEEIRKQSTEITVALLVDDNETIDGKLSQLSYSPQIVSPYYKLLTQDRIKELQGDGFSVIPWTINTEKDMRKFIDWKVNGIITDYPNRLLGLVKR
jgi:glycerophosphoryl diester phosphodiesterase